MAKKETKEMCPKCASGDFSVATDGSKKHYCNSCKHVWVPGVQASSRLDLVLQQAQKENQELKLELTKLRAKVLSLEKVLEAQDVIEDIEE